MNIGNIDMNGGYLGSEEVIKCYQGNTVVWQQSSGSPTPDYSTMPLTFEILSDGNISWGENGKNKTIYYSLNGGEWSSTTSVTIPVVTGDVIQFKGDNNTYGGDTFFYSSFENTTAQFKVCGNIMSLINSTDFSGLTTLTQTLTFIKLFKGCTGLTDASNLVLPATTLTENCYYQMFTGCTSLTTAPELPAPTLAVGCYYGMFRDCRSLTTGPSILPAATLVDNCYKQMFRGCRSLNYIKCLATDISATDCTSQFTYSVAASGTFVTPSTTNWTTGNNGIPTNWTRVNSD